MAAPADKLAASLVVLKELQDAGRAALRAADMTRTHRERLLKNGFISEVWRARASRAPSSPSRGFLPICEPRSRINDVVRKRRGVSADTAMRLARLRRH